MELSQNFYLGGNIGNGGRWLIEGQQTNKIFMLYSPNDKGFFFGWETPQHRNSIVNMKNREKKWQSLFRNRK